MERSPTLLTGRVSRNAMSCLVLAVLVSTPFEAMAYDEPVVSGSIPLRAGAMLLLLIGLRTQRLTAIEAGRFFVAQGLLTMTCWAILLPFDPQEALVEAISYGTIMPVCTLLIAPRHHRRLWALLALGVIVVAAGARLIPGEIELFSQAIVVLSLHAGAVTLLDTHANRAEVASAMADVDALTGLLNRGAALRELNHTVDHAPAAEPASLILLDLDHFKQLNDSDGHAAGDEALRRVSGVLTAFVRPRDVVCRWGGEEFVILLPDADEPLAYASAELLRLRLADTGITASFGVAQRCADDTVTSWVRRADDAMYTAKREGRNTVRLASPEPSTTGVSGLRRQPWISRTERRPSQMADR